MLIGFYPLPVKEARLATNGARFPQDSQPAGESGRREPVWSEPKSTGRKFKEARPATPGVATGLGILAPQQADCAARVVAI